MLALRLCPFCQGRPKAFERFGKGNRDGKIIQLAWYLVSCDACDIMMISEDLMEVQTRWNRRAVETPVVDVEIIR